jgi:hypothetical protein
MSCRGADENRETSGLSVESGGGGVSSEVVDVNTTSEEARNGTEEAAAPLATGPARGLCLDLIAPRRRFLLGEPVLLIVSLRNCSPVQHTVPDLLDPGYGFLATFVKRPGEQDEARHELPFLRDARAKRTRTLAPGERLTVWLPLFVDRRGWFLRNTGTYAVRSTLAVESGRVESSRVTLDVAGGNESDRRAAEILMSPEVSRVLLHGAGPGDAAWPRLGLLVREYPESRLAPYARFFLGLSRAAGGFDPTTKSFREPDCPGAVEDLQWALRRLEDPLFAARGTAATSDCLRALGRAEDARVAVDAYFRAHAGARELPGVAEELRTSSRQAR